MKRIPILLLAAFLLLNVSAQAADLRVTDSAGIEILVKEISIDYGGLLGTDREPEGIRVSQGDAFLTTKWIDIDSSTITGPDAAASRMTVEMALKAGKKVNAQLVRKGRMELTRKADLGDYIIDLEKVKNLTVAYAAPPAPKS